MKGKGKAIRNTVKKSSNIKKINNNEAKIIIIDYVDNYEASRCNEPIKTDYKEKRLLSATRFLLNSLNKNLTIDNAFSTLIPSLIMAYKNGFLSSEISISPDFIISLLSMKPKVHSPENAIIAARFLELAAIALTYIVKRDLHHETDPEQISTYLHPELTIENSLKKMNVVLSYDPNNRAAVTTAKTLSGLPGRGISYPFTGQERILVGKNRIYAKVDGNILVGDTLKRESAHSILTFKSIAVWSQFRVGLKDFLKLSLSNGNGEKRAHFKRSILQLLQEYIQNQRHLVQDFNVCAAKEIAISCMNQYVGSNEPRVALDPCAGWGDRVLGFGSTGFFNKIIANDTNPNLVIKYPPMFKALLPSAKCSFVATKYPAETLTKDILKLERPVDFIMTSPPYFAIEAYRNFNDHGSYSAWAKGFLTPFSNRMSDILIEGGYACIQISNISLETTAKVKTKVIPLIEETKKAFASSGFSLDKQMPYASKELRMVNNKQKASNSIKEGELLLFFKRKAKLPKTINSKSNEDADSAAAMPETSISGTTTGSANSFR